MMIYSVKDSDDLQAMASERGQQINWKQDTWAIRKMESGKWMVSYRRSR
jgi:hypothetical protein